MIRTGLGIVLFAAALAHAQDGVIAGTVRDAVTKRPLPGAAVSIDGTGFQASAVSDGVGAFRFEGLASASYRVRCRLAGYEGSESRGAFHLVDLKSRPVREGLNIDLIPFSSVEGTVFDEEDKPMAAVSIFALGVAHGSTDREGHFQMQNLAPAEYRIELRVPLEIRRQTIKHDDDTGETFGYPNTEYYPGTADFQGALSVPISPGLQLHGVDVHLRRVRLVDLSGRVLEQVGGEPVAEARIALGPNFNSLPGETFTPRVAGRDGAFRFDLIQPGSYSLLISRGAAKLPYVQAVEIGKAGVEGLTVRVPPFQRIEGTIRAATDEAEWSGNIVINLMPMQRGAPSQSISLTNRDFVLDGLPPGRYALHVQPGAVQRPDMRKLVVSSIRMGLQDLTANTMTIAEGGNPTLDIRLSAATGSLKVRVIDPEGAPRVRMIFIRGERKGDAGGGTEAHPTGADGTVTVDDLAPGAYEVAVVALGSLFTATPQFTRIEVKAGDTALVELRPPAR